MNDSNWTGRTHRSMESAFGPYARTLHEDKPASIDRRDGWVLVACVLAVIVLAIAGCFSGAR